MRRTGLPVWMLLGCLLPTTALCSEAPPLVGTLWEWHAVRGADSREIEQPGHYTLELDAQGKTALRADCNRGRGSYTREGDRLTFGPAALTRAACGPASLDGVFLRGLGQVQWKIEGGELLLRSEDGASTMAFRARPTVALPGTSWLVRALNDGKQAVVSVAPGTVLTLRFGPDGELSGSSGCNRYGASYELEADRLGLGPVHGTRSACPGPEGVMKQEGVFLTALRSAATWQQDGERLQLRTAGGSLAVDLVAAVTGSLVAAEPIPTGARVEVRLEDVSLADAPAVLLGKQVFEVGDAQAAHFEIVYDPARIDARHRYAIGARVTDPDGRLLSISTRVHPVITHDAPHFDVEVALEPAG